MLKQSILNLFEDNAVGAISAEDLRIFVNTIFDSKENEIKVFDNLSDIDVYRLQNPEYPINQNDAIIIKDPNNTNTIKERGLYISLVDNPSSLDVFKLANINYDEFIKTGLNGQIVSIQDGELTWIEPLEGYYIEGTLEIQEILLLRPSQKGPVYIAKTDDLTAPIPGKEGDGYSWNGNEWINVGQLRGPAGNIQEVAFATQYEVDGGYVEDKAVAPKTLKNYYRWNTKEDYNGNPNNDDMMLTSKINGQRNWETPVRGIEDLNDVTFNNLNANSIILYNGSFWQDLLLSDIVTPTFISLNDTPIDYKNHAEKQVTVNSSETGLVFTDPIKKTRDLEDVDPRIPMEGQILVYTTGKWTPSTNVKAGISSTRPLNPIIGYMFFDATLGIPVWYNGAHWVNAMGEIS